MDATLSARADSASPDPVPSESVPSDSVPPASVPPDSVPAASPVPPSRRWILRALLPGVVLLVVIAALIVVATVQHRHKNAPPDAATIGLPVLIGDTVHEPGGGTTKIWLDPAINIDSFAEVPAGILLDTDGDPNRPAGGPGGHEMYLQTPGGGETTIATGYDSRYHLTSDGRIVVLVESDGYVHAIDLATGSDRKTRFADGPGTEDISQTDVSGVSDDWALLTNSRLQFPNQPNELWNVRTGAVVPFTNGPNVEAFLIGPDGHVLFGAYGSATATPDDPSPACFDYAAPATADTTTDGTPTPTWATTGTPGVCASIAFEPSSLSPDGTWAIVVADGEADAINLTELHAGRWHPIPVIELGSEPMFWDAPTSFIDTDERTNSYGEDQQNRYQRCFVDGHCEDLGAADAAIVGQQFA